MYKPFVNAHWIWGNTENSDHDYCYFRKKILVPESWVTTPILRITAQTKYKLYINGKLKMHGPAPSIKANVFAVDEIPIPEAKPGSTLAILVYASRGGVIAEINEIGTDKSWLSAVGAEFRCTTLDDHGIDLMQTDGGASVSYICSGVPEKSWLPANLVDGLFDELSATFEPRELPIFTSYPVAIGNVVEFANAQRHLPIPSEPGVVQYRLSPFGSGTIEAFSDELGNGWLITPNGKDISVIFDFGEIQYGFLTLNALCEEPNFLKYTVCIDYAVGNNRLENSFDDDNKREDYNWLTEEYDYLGRDYSRLTNVGGLEAFSARAIRYLRVTFLDVNAPVRLYRPIINQSIYPSASEQTRLPASFLSSDARLDRIWEIGKTTLLHTSDDRLRITPGCESEWPGGTRITAIGARYVFGDNLLHRRHLRQTAQSQSESGWIHSLFPISNQLLPEWQKTIYPEYVAIYILSVYDYYLMTADGDLISQILPSVEKALGWLGGYGASEGGLLINLPGDNFTDRSEIDGIQSGFEGINAPVNLFYLLALRAAAKLHEATGNEGAALSCRTRADMIARAFDSLFWNPLRGVYVDAVYNGEQSPSASMHTNTLVLLCEIGAENRRMSVAENLVDEGELIPIETPYFGFYLIHALAKIGWHQDALDYLRDKWGDMMDSGATTWWSEFNGSNYSKRTDGGGIAPNIWLPQQILGVTAHEPGFACVNIAPKPCDLRWAKGIVPIPQGSVMVSWRKSADDTRFTLDVSVPTGVHVRPILPCSPSDTLYVDGVLVNPDSIVRRVQTGAELAVLPGSGYRFEVVTE